MIRNDEVPLGDVPGVRFLVPLVVAGVLGTSLGPVARAEGPGATASSLVPSDVHASFRTSEGFKVTVWAVNRSDALSARPPSGTRGNVCVSADRTTQHADVVTIVQEFGCADTRSYAFDPTSWTASAAARIPSQVTVTVARRVGHTLRVLSSRRRTSSTIVQLEWAGYGAVTPRHSEGVSLGYLPGVEASVWFSRLSQARGDVTLGGLHRQFSGTDRAAGMDLGARPDDSNDF